MIVWGEFQDLDHTWPEYTHRYLLRGIERHCGWSDRYDKVLVYTKMGPVLIVGFATGERQEGWEGTDVGLLQGKVPAQRVVLTQGFGNFLKERISRADAVQGKISEQQRDKIGHTVLANKDRFANSDQMEAMLADVRTFGLDSILDDD